MVLKILIWFLIGCIVGFFIGYAQWYNYVKRLNEIIGETYRGLEEIKQILEAKVKKRNNES